MSTPKQEEEAQVAVLSNDISYIREAVSDIKATMVTRPEFAPVKAIVYGLVGLISTGVVSALLFLVLKK